ncbi:unnamed protein product [Blepharisma stoltei]|uniref:AB hydrolase-1 domain-containing protein n=1 Tax=Blepharisma stoltei TaxID=1481888 RepID=A0AAU9JJN6_9CILI|nr:unnamed protein product [Blepharisma stoltei]
MGRLSHKKLLKAEKHLLELAEIPTETTRIYLDHQDNYSIFCLQCGDPGKPPMIMVHGYMGSSVMFYRILKGLCQEYRLYCLDLLGMGRSSRPCFMMENREECEDFFVYPIEVCRDRLGIEKFVLAGHSFGGYVSGCYAEKYPNRVEKLVLISPIGIPRHPIGWTFQGWMESQSWKDRFVMRLVCLFWGKKMSGATILRNAGPFSGKIIEMYLGGRISGISEKEMNSVYTYLEQVNLYPGSGEYSLDQILDQGLYALSPLCDRLINVPIVYLYGDRDWILPDGAEQNSKFNSCPIITEIISNSGHHMYLDNPHELVTKILRSVKELDNMHKLNQKQLENQANPMQ